MKHGYVIKVINNVAEICEFETITILTMPDGSKLYCIHTKYGDEYYPERDLSESREKLIGECESLNKALAGATNERSVYKVRRQR